MRRHQLRVRARRVQLVHDGLLAVPLWPVQSGRGVHGSDRLPSGGVHTSVGDRPDLHHGRRRRRRYGRADRPLLDHRPPVAPLSVARHQLSGGGPGVEHRRERLRRPHLLRQALHVRPAGQRRGRVGGGARSAHGRNLPARRRGLLAGGGRRGHLHLRRRALLRLHGGRAPEPTDRRHGPDPDRARLLAGGGRRGHLHLRRRRPSSAPPGANR